MKFAEVIVPVAVPATFTYLIPEEWKETIVPGVRVIVQFGAKKRYAGVVKALTDIEPDNYQVKEIEAVMDELPVVNELQLKFWQWLSEYYMCTIGEVLGAALPAGMRIASETRIFLNPDREIDYEELSDKEFLVIEGIEKQESVTIEDITHILGIKTVYPVVRSLIQKQAILVEEEVRERFRPKVEKIIRLHPHCTTEERLRKVFDELERSPKQLGLLMHLIGMTRMDRLLEFKIGKKALVKGSPYTAANIKELVKKGILIEDEIVVGRLDEKELDEELEIVFSEEQESAIEQIQLHYSEKRPVLLKGVTGSGKTEVYIRLIKEAIDSGKQVLYLLPEIGLTTQLVGRLRRHFGNRIGVYHSRYNIHERVEVWNKLLDNNRNEQSGVNIIIGARSAMFLPFSRLGLVVIDEEHETTFKQYDPAPRYQARDSAIMLAGMFDARVIMGSATPSIESYVNARSGKYGLVEMNSRFGNVKMPEIQCADLTKDTKRKEMRGSFSALLFKEIETALKNKEQVILFQNRRGYSPILQCETCGHIPQCVNCDVSLTYHKQENLLKCHYCGYNRQPTRTCGACRDVNVKVKGLGTEKIAEEASELFPEARVARMDLDTTRGKNSFHNLISQFEHNEIDILVGTQMITKGLDFGNVTLVGILNADQMLNFPDFRASERAFQLMSQVAGRAGRRSKRGRVIIQAFNPHHSVIRQVMEYDYDSMYKVDAMQRRNFKYPPYFRLIRFVLKHKNSEVLDYGAIVLAESLRKLMGKERILGPEYPSISRVRNYYHKHLLLKFERGMKTREVKEKLNEVLIDFRTNQEVKSIRVVVDVDPY